MFVEKVYDKILRERGIHREYDIVFDKWFSVKDNRVMKQAGKNLVT